MSITDFLNDTADRAEGDLKTAVEIQKTTAFPTPGDLHLEKPTWVRIEDVVVVATDLQGSTRISYSKQDRVGARVSGLQIGIDTGTLLAKRIGVRGDHNEPVWAGKPVNYLAVIARA